MKQAYRSTIEPLEARIAPAVFVVTTTADTTDANHDTGSLRDALAQADAHFVPGKINTIDFKLPKAPAGSENEITLTKGFLQSKGNINIVGPGAGKLIINGAGSSNVLYIDDGSYATLSPATISGVSLINGYSLYNGGAINSVESLTLKNVVISGNRSANDGGGVNVFSEAPELASVTIINSLITGNSSNLNSAAFKAYGGGGLACNFVGSVSITNSDISGNHATGYLGGGAFISLPSTGKTISITKSQITGNTAGAGGGLFISNQSGGKVSITGANISGNVSGKTSNAAVFSAGGGLYVNAGATVITGSTILNNAADYTGGGIAAIGMFKSLTIKGSTISGNATKTEETSPGPTNSFRQGGAGLFVYGVATTNPVPISIVGSHIDDNLDVSGGGGGGVYVSGSVSVSISTSTVSGNTTTGETGGGIAMVDNSLSDVKLSVTSSVISNNNARSSGGGIGGVASGSVSIVTSKITGNFAPDNGGGVIIESPSVNLTNDTFTANSVNSGTPIGYGGAICIVDSTFHISGGSISGNLASRGGGIFLQSSAGTIKGASITGNVATNLGGGIDNSNNTPENITIQIAKVTGNSAPSSADVYGPTGTVTYD